MNTPDPDLQKRLYQILGIVEQQQTQIDKLLRRLEPYAGLERKIAEDSVQAIAPVLDREFIKSIDKHRRNIQEIQEVFNKQHEDLDLLWQYKKNYTYLIFLLVGFVFGLVFTLLVIVNSSAKSKLNDISQRLSMIEKK
jgi:hypothetical protein